MLSALIHNEGFAVLIDVCERLAPGALTDWQKEWILREDKARKTRAEKAKTEEAQRKVKQRKIARRERSAKEVRV